MIRTATATLVAVLALSAAAALPASAATGSGGTAAPDGAPPASGGGSIPAAGTGSTLRSPRAALLGRWQRVTGTLAGVPAGTGVLIQRSDARTGWVTLGRGATAVGGAFSVRWRPDRAGRLTLRALPVAAGSASARVAGVPPTAPTTVYGAQIATEFGPGSFGHRTACGVVLTTQTVGVAHRSLPCGTLVEFYYRGRTVRAPVIDRGPYANGASWDLTTAAARALAFNGLDYVGSLRVGRVSLAR
jgi:rare lipoprotein A